MKAIRKIMFVAVALIAAGAVTAFAQPGEFVKGVLQPLEDGFPNRPIIFMVIDEPGTADSLLAMQTSEAAGPMSPVPIKIEHRMDLSTFGTWEGINWIMDQGKLGNDGYISFIYGTGDAIIDLLVIDMKKDAGVDIDDLNPVISINENRLWFFSRKGAPWGNSMKKFLAYAKANPNSVRYMSGGAGGGMDSYVKFTQEMLNYTVDEIVVGPSQKRALTVAAGEGDFTVLPATSFIQHWQAGKVEVLMGSGPEKPKPPFDSAVSSAEVGIKEDPFHQKMAFGVSPKTPESHRAWLAKLLTAAAKDSAFIKKRESIPGLKVKVCQKDEALKHSSDVYNFCLPIFKKLGIYWGTKK